MPNLSQLKRQRMLEFLNKIKAEHTDDESLIAINEIETEITEKKYGLVWEQHEERVDVEMQTKVPVFTEVADREIASDEELPYNFLLEGDNLHSLKLLEKTHKGKIDVIYIDPPYNTGAKSWKYDNDYVEKDDSFKHSKFASFVYSRLSIAKTLLSSKGIIAVAIDDYETHTIRLILDEIFGEENRLGTCAVVHNPGGRQDDKFFATAHEYMLVYAKDSTNAEVGYLEITTEKKAQYSERDSYGNYKLRSLIRTGAHSRPDERPGLYYPIYIDPTTLEISIENNERFCEEILPADSSGNPRVWRWGPKTVLEKKDKYILCKPTKDNKYALYVKEREDDNKGYKPKTIWIDSKYSSASAIGQIKDIFGTSNSAVFNYPKSYHLMYDIIKILSSSNSVILDFFAGSGTTAQAVVELNKADNGSRKFILCTNNENSICEEVTYNRVKTVISGKRIDGTDYSDGIPANLKYYKTDFIDKTSPDPDYNIEGELLKHIAEMVQLEYAVKLDGTNYVLLMSDEQADNFIANDESLARCKAIYVSTAVLLTAEQQKKLSDNGIAVFVIPDYYFESELLEVGER